MKIQLSFYLYLFFLVFDVEYYITDRLAQSQLQKTSVTVISGAVTTIPVGGSPTNSASSSTSSSTASSTSSSARSSGASTGSSSGSISGSNQSPPVLPINGSNGSGGSGSGPSSQTRLHQDISRLRVDKLELLRQALSAQHEVRQLRQREAQLETDLALAAAEIRRLKNQLKSSNVHGVPGSSSSISSEAPITSATKSSQSHQKNISTSTNPDTSRRTVQMHIPL